MWKSAFKVFASVAVFGVVHSLIASRSLKEKVAERLGERERRAFYRPFYLAQSVVTLAALWAFIRPLPDRVLYHLRGPAAVLLRLGQAAGIGYATYTAAAVGIPRILGLESLLAYLQDERRVPPVPAAQGPALAKDAREMNVSGPFRYHRHPLNFAPLPVFWLNPIMTVKLLAFNLAATLYLMIGSYHEEARLRAAYGEAYRRYQDSGIPFYWPKR